MSELTPLGKEIRKILSENKWSQREIAIKAGIDPANISRMMRGKQEPSHTALEKIAKALKTDAAYLKRLGGIWAPPPPPDRDPNVEALALRLNDMPQELREPLIEMINNQIDTIELITNAKIKTWPNEF